MEYLHIVDIIDNLLIPVTMVISWIYGAFAKTWIRAIIVVLGISIVSSVIGLYDITLAADGKKNILACFLFPFANLIQMVIARAIKLMIFDLPFFQRKMK